MWESTLYVFKEVRVAPSAQPRHRNLNHSHHGGGEWNQTSSHGFCFAHPAMRNSCLRLKRKSILRKKDWLTIHKCVRVVTQSRSVASGHGNRKRRRIRLQLCPIKRLWSRETERASSNEFVVLTLFLLSRLRARLSICCCDAD